MIKIEYKAKLGRQASNVFQTLHVCIENGHLPMKEERFV